LADATRFNATDRDELMGICAVSELARVLRGLEPGTQTLEQLDGHGTVETVEPANFFVPAPLLDPYAALEAVRLTWCHAPAFRGTG
jgi:hypothetical protein